MTPRSGLTEPKSVVAGEGPLQRPPAELPQPLIPQTKPAEPTAPRSRWQSADLFGSAQEIEIEHGQAVYRLRLTTLGKLILTK